MRYPFLLLALSSILFFSSFSKPVESYKLDLHRSKIEWTGKKVTGQHHGEIKLSAGDLNVNNNKLIGGLFTVDMTSISIADLKGSSATKLLAHLKSDDFFSTDENPTSKFTITKVVYQSAEKALVTGNLIIKGISKTLTFPTTIKEKSGVIVAIANGVKVDRTKYNITYGSESFISGLGDKAIDNDFEINIHLVAKK